MREGPLAALFRNTETPDEGEEVREEPATAPPQAEVEAPEAPTIPTPQERLRHAFSSEIPENVLSPATPAARERPRVDPLAEPGPDGNGHPVLRVIGRASCRERVSIDV